MLRTVKKIYNTTNRTFWTTASGLLKNHRDDSKDVLRQVTQNEGLLVSSLCEDGNHAPVLDINFLAQLIPSTTPGHFHLYLGKKISWDKYKQLLRALYDAGIIEREFYENSITKEQSMVLVPGKDKNRVIERSAQLT